MPRFISGRSKLTPQTGLTSDRYKYLSVSDSEPNIGDPIIGPSAWTGSVPAGQQYILVNIEGQDPGNRFWIPNQGGIIPGTISVFEEGTLVGGLSSTTQLNFIGQAITAEGVGGPNPGVAVTITVAPPGNPNEVLFVSAGSTDFATDTRFIFDDGLLKTGDRITVGAGGTVITTTGIGSVGIGTTQPTENLHLEGDFRITGTIYDSTNKPGDTGDLITKTATGGLLWITPSSVNSGAGGTIGQIQFHNTAGLVDGADNFYFDFNNNRVGIGSTQPTQLLDVLGVSTFSGGVFVDDLSVSGFSTFTEIIDANGGLDVFGHTELDSVNVSGLSTFGNNVDINVDLDVDGTTDLDILNVAEAASFTATTDNTLGNTNTGAVQIDGGVGIDKNLTVGQGIQATNLNITGVGTIAQFDFGVGQFDDITVLGVSTLGNVIVEGNTIKTKTGTGNLILDSDGSSASIVANDFLFVTKNTESTSKDTGSIITEGGIGVEKSVFIGLNLDVDGQTELDTLNVSVASSIASLTLANAGIAVTAILDEDDMVSDRDDALATQQSIKSYVDSRVTAQDLDFAGDSGTGNVDLDSQTFTIAGTTNEIETVGSGQTLTIGLPDDIIIGNTLTVTGITSLNGNVDLGDATDDTISLLGKVDTDILPASDGTLGLGSVGSKWDNVYANTFVGAITGNADTATALETARNFSISGDGSAPNVSFDGTADVDLELTLDTVNTDVGTFGDSITVPQVTVNGKGLVTGVTSVSIDFGAANVATADSLSNSRNIAATGDIAWNVDFKGHEDVSGISTLKDVGPGAGIYGGDDEKVLSLTIDDKGRITGISSVDINFSDANVATADSLSNSRNIAATGDIAWNVDFKGHEDVSGIATLATVFTAGIYGGDNKKVLSITADDKGRIIGISSVDIQFDDANVATADSLSNSRNIAATGDIAWNVDFKGHEDVTGVSTLKDVGPGSGTYGGENTKVLSLTLDDKGRITGVSSVSINFGLASVATADSLTDSRNIAATGDIAWNVDFKGHEDVSGIATLSSIITPGTVGSSTQVGVITFDAKGRITAASNVNISTATNSGTADNLSGGTAGDIPYQDGPGSTTFLADPGVSGDGYVLTWNNGSTAPQWSDLTTLGGSGYTLSAVDNGNDADIVLTDAVGGASSITVTAGSNITIDPVGVNGFTISAVDGAGVGVAASASDVLNVNGGQIGGVDPNADRIVFWDDSASKLTYLTAGTGLTISGTTITANSDAGKTYTLDAVDSGDNAILRLSDGSTNEDVLITAGSNITIDPVASGGFTINAVAGGGGGGGGGELLSDVDVKQYSNNNTPRTEYGCSNPIDVTVSAGIATIGIGSTSNAYGKRYVQETEPTTDVCDGDIWYDLTGTSGGSGSFVTGMIMMFSGTTAPSGWAFCDGTNGTPDLRNRFIMAAHSMSKTGTTSQAGPTFDATTGAVNESGQYEPGDIGGEAAHQLTEAELARHRHTYNGGNFKELQGDSAGLDDYANSGGNTGRTGEDKYHENRPPYYALAFIMKT